MFYDGGTAYRRRLVDPRGDECVFFALGDDRWREIVDHADPGWTGGGLFRFARGPIRPALALRAAALVRARLRDPGRDPLAIEEALLELGAALVSDAARAHDRPVRDAPITARHRDQVHALEALLSARFREDLGLDALAAAVGLSPFHAARLFRRFTGASLHRYREDLRLHAALAALPSAPRLDALALELGFASHRHFTDRFSRRSGVPPSRVRGEHDLESARPPRPGDWPRR